MENKSFFSDSNETDLHVSPQSREFLKEIVKWTKFLSVLGFIGIAFMFLGGFSMGLFMGSLGNLGGSSSGFYPPYFSPWTLAFFYWILAAVYIMPVYYLFQFSDKLSKALTESNTSTLTESFRYLKSHYKFLGICMIVVLSIYAIAIIIAIIAVVALAATVF